MATPNHDLVTALLMRSAAGESLTEDESACLGVALTWAWFELMRRITAEEQAMTMNGTAEA
jgi:hypothetical protein